MLSDMYVLPLNDSPLRKDSKLSLIKEVFLVLLERDFATLEDSVLFPDPTIPSIATDPLK